MNFIEENKIQNQRLRSVLTRINPGNWSKDIGGGWTIGTQICHLAFWDKITFVRLQKWKETGRLTPVPDADNIEAINDSTRSLFGSISYPDGIKLVTENADEIDALVAILEPAILTELDKTGRERWYKRSLHRDSHLTRIENSLK